MVSNHELRRPIKRDVYNESMLEDFDSCSQISLHRKKNTDDEAEDELEGGG